MKIGLFIDELFTGGFQKVALEEALNLKNNNHDVYFYILRRTERCEFEDILEKAKIPVIYLSDRIPRILNINFKFPLFSFFSLFHITYPFIVPYYFKENLDVIIAHGTYTSLSAIKISKNKNIKLINFVHDPIEYILTQKYNQNFAKKRLFKALSKIGKKVDAYILKNSYKVLAFPEMVSYMKRRHSLDNKYVEIMNGVTIREKIYKKRKYALASTKWDSGKNVFLLIDIWDKLQEKIPLRIIGKWADSDLRSKFIQTIKYRGLKNKIAVTGELSTEQMNKYYGEAQFLVHPCKEAFGLTILEAAAQRTTAIFTNNSGVAKLFNKKNSIQVKEDNLDDYVYSVNKLAKNPRLCLTMGETAYRYPASNNSWEEHVIKIEAVLK